MATFSRRYSPSPKPKLFSCLKAPAVPMPMALRLGKILEHDAPHLGVTKRKQLLAFYDALKTARKKSHLTPEESELPTSLNELLARLPSEQPPAKRDRELTDWSVENDPRYAKQGFVALEQPYKAVGNG